MEKFKFNRICLLLLLVFLLLLTGCGQPPLPRSTLQPSNTTLNVNYPLTITNYNQQENLVSYTYQSMPTRVVITHPGATELLLELGLQDRILSTVAPYGAPLGRVANQYAKLTIMQSPYTPSQEDILELQPNMIISWVHQFSPYAMGDVETWHERGIGTFIMPSTLTKTKPTLENTVYSSLSDFGKIFAIQKQTDLYIQQAKDRVIGIEKAVMKVEQRKTVLVLQDHFNGTFSMYDPSYLISPMIDIAGGSNICQAPAAFVSAEKVLAFDPDVILFVTSDLRDNTRDLTDSEAVQHLQEIKELQSMRAIRAGNIINLPFFTVNNGGVRTIDAIEKIAKYLYPEQFL
jgi:iron complex transport system substrate-binding protein